MVDCVNGGCSRVSAHFNFKLICFIHPSLFDTIYHRVSYDFYSGFLLRYFMNIFIIWLVLFRWIIDFIIFNVILNFIIWSLISSFSLLYLLLLLFFLSCSSIFVSALLLFRFEAIETSISLFTISFLDCNSMLVMLLNESQSLINYFIFWS